MVHYIQQIAKDIVAQWPNPGYTRLPLLTEEINRLDPRDFLVAAQYDFVIARYDLRDLSRHTPEDKLPNEKDITRAKSATEVIIRTLDLYGGEGSKATVRSFQFIHDKDLRTIIERDYAELTLNLFPSGAWKSTVIMAGSITEAILFDLLRNDQSRNHQALGANSAPKSARNGPPLPLEDENWKLHSLLTVAGEIGLLPVPRVNTFDQILRDYRNFVHPTKEMRAAHPCQEAEACMAKGALDGICDHFDRTLVT